MKLLVIDNYDSFTYNLVQLFGEMEGVDLVVKLHQDRLGSHLPIHPESLPGARVGGLHFHLVAPEEALHVGDSLHADVGGARAAGVRPVLLDRRGRYSPEQVGEATVIRSLAELPALLD